MMVSLGLRSKEAITTPLVEQNLRRQDQFWDEITWKLLKDAYCQVTKELDALVHEEMGMEEATGTCNSLGQGKEREESAKEKMLKDLAGAALEAAVPATPKAPVGGAKRLVSSVKKLLRGYTPLF
ncbi:hypothetical protein C0993_006047 [Termitomyces sp. T159_Od127]|nr:hypothetical protein C0993_006047 [Termitomyces sp. T159_Od127]